MLFYSAILLTFIGIGFAEFLLSKKGCNKVVLVSLKILPFFILFFLTVLKKDTVGYDSITYHNWYNLLSNGQKPSGSYAGIEIGFRFLMELFASAKSPYIVFLIVCNIIIYLPTSIAVLKLSKNSGFSAFIYACLSIMVFNFSALRQAISISFALLSLIFTFKKKWWSIIVSFVLIIIASLFHKSGFAFVLTIPLVYIPINKKAIYYIIPLAIVFFFITPPIVMSFYYGFLYGSPYYPITRNGVGEYYFFFLTMFAGFFFFANYNQFKNLIRSFFCFIECKITKREKKKSDDYDIEENNTIVNPLLLMFFIGVLFQSTSQVNFAFPRFATQFLAIISIAAINIIMTEKHNLTRIALLSIVLLGFYLFFLYDSILPNYLGVCPYLFFWQ